MQRTPNIPLAFGQEARENGGDPGPAHLLEVRDGDYRTITWPVGGLSIIGSSASCKSLDDFLKHTPGLRRLGEIGFAIGQYAEVFVCDRWGGELPTAYGRFGDLHASLGEVSPLAQVLFEGHRDPKYHGEWEFMSSLRLTGELCASEASVLFALSWLGRELHRRVEVFPLSDPDWGEEEGEVPEAFAFPSLLSELEPLRLYQAGMIELDDQHALLQFYRVLEYFSTFRIYEDIRKWRHDASLNNREFCKKVLAERGSERAHLCRLVSEIADPKMVAQACEDGLIKAGQAASDLGNAIYDKRCSIVHAKSEKDGAIHSRSIFDTFKANPWRPLCRELAWEALIRHGRRAH